LSRIGSSRLCRVAERSQAPEQPTLDLPTSSRMPIS
jgi:hypothetical protein